MENFDQFIINQLQSVFDEYNSSKNKECNDVTLSLQNISNVVTKLTPNKPFSYFTKKYSITSSDLWTTPRTLENFVYKLSNIKVLKEGVLYRRGSYISSNWKPSWVVLTDTGYLHCFKLKSLSKSTIRQFTIHKKGNGENILKAGQDTYKNVDKVKTSFSIQLRSPRVIAVDSSVHTKDNDQDHCFSIIINNSAFNVVPTSQENVNEENEANNNNNAPPKKLKSNKNQVVHQLKADREDIMQDWLDVINLKLKNIPLEVQPAISTSNVNLSEDVYGSSNTLSSNNNVKSVPPVFNATEATAPPMPEDDEQEVYTAEGEDNSTPLNGQIYLPFKSMSTLIEEVNAVNENIKDSNTNVDSSMNRPTIKSIKSSESIKYYLDGSKPPQSRECEGELTPEESAMLTKNIITSNTNIGQDIDLKDITKTVDYFGQLGSDMTLNQKNDSD